MSIKSGLGDSPLFVNPVFERPKPVTLGAKLTVPTSPKSVETIPNKTPSSKSKLSAKRSPVQVNERSNEQVNERSGDQTVNRSDGQDYRPTVRHTYDFYLDQVHSIEDEVVRRSRQRGKAATKGEVMREIVDFYFAKRKK